MSWQKIKFGTDGWRAIIAEDFTFDNVAIVAAAIGRYIDETYPKEKPVLVSYDPRFLADKFAEHAVKVLATTGREVLLTDRDTPTPVIAHAAKDLKSAGALQFTASHNPPEYCGIKYIPDYAGPANSQITERIKAHVDELGRSGFTFDIDKNSEITVKKFSPKESYVKALKNLLDIEAIQKSNLKIGVDTLCGAGRGYYQEFIQPTVSIGEERDPLFRGALPEPIAKTLTELIDEIKSQNLDIGLANDGDADRFAIIDGLGTLYSSNQILAILIKYLVENKGWKGAVVRTVSVTHLLDKLAEKLGVPIVETSVGFKYIAEVMLKEDVLIGGEESGGLSILGHIPEKDGILACLLVCEVLVKTKKTLAELWQEVIDFTGFVPYNNRLDLRLTNAIKEKSMKDLHQNPPKEIANLKVSEIVKKDGVKLILENGDWILVRPSGTEPVLRVYLESCSADGLERIEESIKKEFQADTKALAGAH
ncbi:MAG: phosphoglucomutase/phosphomannomutase family protein [Candidatus Caenarcaniphilales bacterium]|nr:phosphoglucomutase/phosphomannomutase family protein [Candidatus Caenarcaniphilales bacterium]